MEDVTDPINPPPPPLTYHRRNGAAPKRSEEDPVPLKRLVGDPLMACGWPLPFPPERFFGSQGKGKHPP
jgi:hypothetical protein